MTIWALILKKAPADAKSRLAGVMDVRERQALVEKLFCHVLTVALQTEAIHRVAVISPEPPNIPESITWLKDAADDRNNSIAQGLQTLTDLGAGRVLIIPSDLPQLESADLRALISASGGGDMVIAPDEAELGTNALLLTMPMYFPPCFGVNSYEKHLEQARRAGMKTRVVKRPGLGFDLDDAQDLARYRAGRAAPGCTTV